MLAAVGCSCAAWSAGPVELRFVVWDGDEAQRVLRPAIRDFERAHPGIKVKFESVTQNYQQKLLAQYAANCAPDVAMMDPANFQRYAKRGALLPLNPFFGDVPGFDIKKYYKKLVDAHSYRGTLYVLPRDIAPISLIYYNKRLFREAGIPYPDGSWTWDFKVRPELREKDFLWVMRELTKKDARGRTIQWGYSPGWPNLTGEMFAYSLGAWLADDDEAPRKVFFDDPRRIRAFQFAADLWLKHGWAPSPTELSSVLQESALQVFIGQKVAMFQSGIWDTPRIREANPPGSKDFFDWDIVMAPKYKDGSLACPSGGSGYCILSSTKHPKEAWKLVAWMAGPPGMLAMAKAGLAQPGIEELALSEPWIPGPNTPYEQQWPKSRIVTHQAVQYCEYGPTADYWQEVNSFGLTLVENVFTGRMTAREALTKGNRQAQARLDTMLRERRLPAFNWPVAGGAASLVLVGMLAWVYVPEFRRGRRLTQRERAENRAGYLFVMPWILGMVVFTLGPMMLSMLMSFADWDIIQPAKWRGLDNYVEALTTDPRFWVSLRVTFVYTLFAVPLGLMGSLALALLLNVRVRGMPLFRACYYVPSLASAVAGSLIWRRIFQPEGGLLNAVIYGADGKGDFLGLATLLSRFTTPGQQINWLGTEQTALPAMIIMSLWGVGGGMVILLAGLQGIPQHYYEAATVDGAGAWRRFRNVTVPLLSPALFFSLITGVIGSFQVFTQAFVMTGGGPNDSTRFYMLHLYTNAFDALRMGYASALAWVMFLIILVFTLLQLKLSRFVYYEGAGR